MARGVRIRSDLDEVSVEIAADLRHARNAAEAGELAGAELSWLIGLVETGRWFDPGVWPRSEGDGILPLGPEERREAKRIAAHAIHRQHGGYYRAPGAAVAWTSVDGYDLAARMA